MTSSKDSDGQVDGCSTVEPGTPRLALAASEHRHRVGVFPGVAPKGCDDRLVWKQPCPRPSSGGSRGGRALALSHGVAGGEM